MLPTAISAPHRLGSRVPEFVRRALRRDQMDVDSALSQFCALCSSNSSLVFKISKARKMTKNHYYRDDPAFLVLQSLFLAATTIAFGLALRSSVLHTIYNVIYQVGINYIVVGAILASASWTVANRVLMAPAGQLHEVRREVEWQYAFDIHCNGYVPYFMATHVVHFIALPFLMQMGFLPRLTANLLFAFGISSYFYVTFRGYLELPSLHRQQLILYPIVGVVALAVLMSFVTSINMSHVVLYYVWVTA